MRTYPIVVLVGDQLINTLPATERNQFHPDPSQKLSTNVYDIYHCWVNNSWWWTEELSETCRVSFQNKLEKLVHLVGFIVRIFVMMQGHMNVKCCTEFYLYFFIWRLGVVVLISFTEGWVLWFWLVSLPHPPSPDYQMFGNHFLIHTYIELLAWFLEYSQLARRKSMLAMWWMHMLKICGKWQVDTGHGHQSSCSPP
jgi:hypothetical protein